MEGITLILGGARSGKSGYAEKIALAYPGPVTYLATADCADEEMACRIALHKARRPASWTTWEGEPNLLPDAVAKTGGLMLMDCLTMWLTRLALSSPAFEKGGEPEWFAEEAKIAALTEKLCRGVQSGASLVIVSNEVGLGLVPSYRMGRRFRDTQGRMNRLCAEYAERVALVVAGCPLWVKGSAPRSL